LFAPTESTPNAFATPKTENKKKLLADPLTAVQLQVEVGAIADWSILRQWTQTQKPNNSELFVIYDTRK
jgi:hypothetical protein